MGDTFATSSNEVEGLTRDSFAPSGLGFFAPHTHALRRGLISVGDARLASAESVKGCGWRIFGQSWFLMLGVIGLAICIVGLSGCSGEKKEPEPTVPVQIVSVEKTTLEHTVTSEAVLF